jgi:hypothetical protein
VAYGRQQKVIGDARVADPIGTVMLGAHEPPDAVSVNLRSAGC